MIKAIELDGIRINLIDAGDTEAKLEKQIGGKLETIMIRDGGVMICDREAMPKDLPYNNIASLIAGTAVYGKALIVGGSHEKFEDMPGQYAALLSFPEVYFQ